MSRHARPRRRLDRTTLVQLVLVCAPLAGFIGWSMGGADIPVIDCYTNPDVRGTFC